MNTKTLSVWKKYVLPFFEKDCSELTLVDIECDSGMFTKLAKDNGFKRVIGVTSSKRQSIKAFDYCKKDNSKCEIYYRFFDNYINYLPVCDYVILFNINYNFLTYQFLDLLDRLQNRTRYCIVVTSEKDRKTNPRPSPRIKDIRKYFRQWDEVEFIEGSKFKSLCFKSRSMERVSIESLSINDNEKYMRESIALWKTIDKNDDLFKTAYYRLLVKCRRSENNANYRNSYKLIRFMLEKMKLYRDIKKHRIKDYILVDDKNEIIDGHHRYTIMKHLGYKSILIRRI